MRQTTKLTIEPDYEGDFTSSWGNRCHQDIFPSVYQRFRAPADADECRAMIDDLTELITEIDDSYQSTRQNAVNLGINPLHDTATKDTLKRIKSAKFRNEAVRRAYIHWLTLETGGADGLPVLGRTQISKTAKMDMLAAAMVRLCDIYEADVNESSSSEDLSAQINTLRIQLKAYFNV